MKDYSKAPRYSTNGSMSLIGLVFLGLFFGFGPQAGAALPAAEKASAEPVRQVGFMLELDMEPTAVVYAGNLQESGAKVKVGQAAAAARQRMVAILSVQHQVREELATLGIEGDRILFAAQRPDVNCDGMVDAADVSDLVHLLWP